tara:strand:- start:15 stop:422 length:408 start_codon:yes stop_codon:yes gene_type:complete
MAFIKEIKRINPLDSNKNATIGVGFPINEKNLFQGTKTISEQNKANLINLLLTQPGERINLPDYGVGIKSYLFEPNINIEVLKGRIVNKIQRYIPNISLTEIKINKSDDERTIFMTVVYKNLLNNMQDSIQLNFR